MAETELYEPVKSYLNLSFRDRVSPLRGVLRGIAAITATAGGQGSGKWSRPDLMFLALWRQKHGTSWLLDLHGFEVKPRGRCTADAVHEALNHTSHVHFAHLAWHAPDWRDDDRSCADLLQHCQRFGVGLITFSDPKAVGTFVTRSDAARHEPSGDAVDEFIETRLPAEELALLSRWLDEVR